MEPSNTKPHTFDGYVLHCVYTSNYYNQACNILSLLNESARVTFEADI